MMIITLDEIKKQYPHALYPPDPDCKRCHGTGTYILKSDGTKISCPCLYFDPAYREKVVSMLAEFARGELEKLERGE